MEGGERDTAWFQGTCWWMCVMEGWGGWVGMTHTKRWEGITWQVVFDIYVIYVTRFLRCKVMGEKKKTLHLSLRRCPEKGS